MRATRVTITFFLRRRQGQYTDHIVGQTETALAQTLFPHVAPPFNFRVWVSDLAQSSAEYLGLLLHVPNAATTIHIDSCQLHTSFVPGPIKHVRTKRYRHEMAKSESMSR